MGMYINSATSSMALTRSLYQTSVTQTNIMKRLSSGIRINSASDDAAGLSLSQKLTSVINGNAVAKNNAQTGISFLNTADGALSVMTNSLERIRNLAVQSTNGVYSLPERQMLQKEVSQLMADMNSTYNTAIFSSTNVFSGTVSGASNIDSALNTAGYDQNHIIHDAAELVSKITGHETESFILAGDIDLSTLGTLNHSVVQGTFSGSFDGNGFNISNLSVIGPGGTDLGFFEITNGATIKNLNLIAGYVDNSAPSGYGAGILAGELNNSNVSNCHSSGTVIGGGDAGGLIGATKYSSVSNCSSSVTVSNSWHGGGLSGHVWGSTIDSSYATGSVTGGAGATEYNGGLLGVAEDSTQITNSYATGTVSATQGRAGGLAGYLYNGSSAQNSYAASGTISAPTTGGLCPYVVGASDDATNFYQNGQVFDGGTAVNGDLFALPTGGWNTTKWDLSGALPVLKEPAVSYIRSAGATGGLTTIQIGDDARSTSQIALNTSFSLPSLSFDVSSQSSASQAISDTDQLMDILNTLRSKIGSDTNKLTSILNIQNTRILNISASKSTIADADMAVESANLVKNQIRGQAAVTLMSQTKNLDKNLLISLIDTNR